MSMFTKKPNAGFSYSGSLPKSAYFLRLWNNLYIRWCKKTHIYNYILTRFVSERASKNESANYVCVREHQARRGTDPEFVSSSPSGVVPTFCGALQVRLAKLNLQRYSLYPPIVKTYLNTPGSDQSSLI